jgi:hypothetical protein
LIVPLTPLLSPRPLLLAGFARLELLLAGFARLELLLAGFARARLLELFARGLPFALELRFGAELDRLAVADPLRAVLDALRAVPEVLDWAISRLPLCSRALGRGHTQRARHERSGKNAPVQR